METLAEATLFLLPVWGALLLLLGETLQWVIRGAIRWRWPTKVGPELPLIERLIWDLGLGTSFVPLLYVAATSLAVPLGALFAEGLAAAVVLLSALRLAVWLRHRSLAGDRLLPPLGLAKWEWFGILGLFAISLSVRLIPYLSLWVYAGTDVRVFTRITELVTTTGRLPHSWESAALPSWNLATDPHLYFSGSEAIFAALGFLVPLGLPQVVSAATVLFSAAIPLSVYVLTRELFPGRGKWVAFVAAAVLAAVSAYPLFFLQWGGIDETVGWFVLPIALAVIVRSIRVVPFDWSYLVLGGIMVGGLIVIAPVVTTYFLVFAAATILEATITRVSLARTVASFGGSLGLGVAFVSPVILGVVESYPTYLRAVPAGSLGWGSFATAPMLRFGDVGGSFVRFITNSTPLELTAIVVVTGWVGIALSAARIRYGITVCGWAVGLVLLNENGPFGLYWVKFFGWEEIFPDRPAHALFLPIALGAGLLVGRFLGYLHTTYIVRAAKGPGSGSLENGPNSPGRASPARRTEWLRSRLSYRARFGRGPRQRRVRDAIVLAVVVGTAAYVTVITVTSNNATVAWGSSVTSADLEAFAWMDAHLPPGSTVLVNQADSGTWIPEFTDLYAFPYLQMTSNTTLLDGYSAMVSQVQVGNFSLYIAYAQAFDIRAAFFGSEHAYDLTSPITPEELSVAPPIATYVISSQLCEPPSNQTVLVFACSGDTASFRGPVALTLIEGPAGNHPITYSITVPSGYTFQYSVPNGQGSGSPSAPLASIATQPPASAIFRPGASNAVVLVVNPALWAGSCTGVPGGTCFPSIS